MLIGIRSEMIADTASFRVKNILQKTSCKKHQAQRLSVLLRATDAGV